MGRHPRVRAVRNRSRPRSPGWSNAKSGRHEPAGFTDRQQGTYRSCHDQAQLRDRRQAPPARARSGIHTTSGKVREVQPVGRVGQVANPTDRPVQVSERTGPLRQRPTARSSAQLEQASTAWAPSPTPSAAVEPGAIASCGKGPLASACSAPGGSDPNAPGGRTWHRSRNAIPPIGSEPSARMRQTPVRRPSAS